MQFFTWGPGPNDQRLQPLIQSAAKQGVAVTPIPCRSLLDKLFSLRHALAGLSASELILCSDGYDCLYLQGRLQIESIIGEFPAPIVFSAQAEADHHLQCAVQTARSRPEAGPYPILNSGVIAGRCGDIRAMLDEICRWNLAELEQEFQTGRAGIGHFNDQTLCGLYFARHPQQIAIDSHAKLSWTSAYENNMVDELLAADPFELRNPLTGLTPALFHLPCTSPGVYAQFLRTCLRLQLPLKAEQVQIVRLEQFLGERGRLREDTREVLSVFKSQPGFRSTRRRQYVDHYKRRCRILLSRALRLFIRGGTGAMTRNASR